MAFTNGKAALRKALLGGVAVVTALMLNACGGGGGSSGTNSSGGGSTTPTIALSLVAPSTSTTNLAAYASTTITVKVLSNNVTDTAPVSVTFASPCAKSGKASLPASATTTNGEVTVTYTDIGCSATDAVTIGTTGATSITEIFVVAAPTPASVEFVSAIPATDSIVIAGSGGNGRVETATLTYKVLDTEGNALPNQKVNFSLVPAGSVTLQTTSGLTNASGQVVATVTSLSTATTFRVVATLPSGQSTMSDTITVTTGQTNPESLSLSVGTFNIEGWNYDNVTTNVNVLLADINGNPVADGTPVVSQTDSGAIGTSAIGGCVTANGACVLDFRSQNPRYGAGALAVPTGKRAGLATVTVSTTTANQPTAISGQVGIYLSGSFAVGAVPSVDPTSGITVIAPSGNVNWYTLKVPNCNQATMALQINDVNNNPLPATTTLVLSSAPKGTTVAGPANPPLGAGAIFPTSVPNIGPDVANPLVPVFQGSYHTVTFTPGANCKTVTSGGVYLTNPDSTMNLDGEIDILATAPKGSQSIVKAYVWYPQ
ncbi:MAG TPA: Ig-like domain-containing protein [Burkholderiaceae bacterium]|jgi:hypothetical protein